MPILHADHCIGCNTADASTITFMGIGTMARIFLGYQSALVGARLSEMLTEMNGVDLMGVVFESDKLEHALETLEPEIAIVDIRLLIASRIGDLNVLKTRFPETQFILLYDFPYNQYSRECKRFGAEYCFETLHQFMDIERVVAEYNRRRRTRMSRAS